MIQGRDIGPGYLFSVYAYIRSRLYNEKRNNLTSHPVVSIEFVLTWRYGVEHINVLFNCVPCYLIRILIVHTFCSKCNYNQSLRIKPQVFICSANICKYNYLRCLRILLLLYQFSVGLSISLSLCSRHIFIFNLNFVFRILCYSQRLNFF